LKYSPTTTPSTMAAITWKVKLDKSFFIENKYTGFC